MDNQFYMFICYLDMLHDYLWFHLQIENTENGFVWNLAVDELKTLVIVCLFALNPDQGTTFPSLANSL